MTERDISGNRVFLSGLLSKDTHCRVWVTGPVGVKELDVLIERLTLDREILSEDAALSKSTEGAVPQSSPEAGGDSITPSKER